MVIRSTEFDDIYFSTEDGLAESNYVFLQHNKLPERWAGREQFTICELGFGSGLNFLTTWDAFENTAETDQTLHFISFEKYPLSLDQIREGLSHWHADLGDKLEKLLDLIGVPLRPLVSRLGQKRNPLGPTGSYGATPETCQNEQNLGRLEAYDSL